MYLSAAKCYLTSHIPAAFDAAAIECCRQQGVTAPDPLGQLDRATVYLALMAAAEAGEAPYGDVRQPPAGSWEADVLAAHRGSVVDVPGEQQGGVRGWVRRFVYCVYIYNVGQGRCVG